MKKLLYVLAALIVFSACKKKEKDPEPELKKSIVGTWRYDYLIEYEDADDEENYSKKAIQADFDFLLQFESDGQVNFVVFEKGKDKNGFFGDSYTYENGKLTFTYGYAMERANGLEAEAILDDDRLEIILLGNKQKNVLVFSRSQKDISSYKSDYSSLK